MSLGGPGRVRAVSRGRRRTGRGEIRPARAVAVYEAVTPAASMIGFQRSICSCSFAVCASGVA